MGECGRILYTSVTGLATLAKQDKISGSMRILMIKFQPLLGLLSKLKQYDA